MRLVSPQYLWFLFLLAIPIIVHLYRFRRYKTLYFSSLKFVRQVEQESRSTKNLKHLLVLLLRCLAIAALVFAFARPYIPTGNANSKSGQELIGIYLDNSMSMSQQGTEGELFHEAREAIRTLLQNQSPSTKYLFCSNELNAGSKLLIGANEVEERMDRLSLSNTRRTFSDIQQHFQQSIQYQEQKGESIASAKLIYLSDFQKLNTNTSTISADSTNTHYLWQFIPQNKQNLSIDSVWFSKPIARTNDTRTIFFKVSNHGPNAAKNVEMSLKIGSMNKDLFADIEGRSSQTIEFSYTESANLSTTNLRLGELRLEDPNVPFDNAHYFTYTVDQEVKALIINGEDSVGNVRSVLELDPYIKISSVNQRSLTRANYEDANLIIFNGFNEFPSGLSSQMEQFIENQGSILFFPGSELSTNDWRLAASKFNLPSVDESKQEYLAVRNIAYQDPFFAPVFERKPEKVDIDIVQKYYPENQRNASLRLMTLDNGAPLLSASLNRQAFFFHTALTDSFSDLVKSDLFVSTILRAAETSIRPSPLSITAGKSDLFPVNVTGDGAIELIQKDFRMIPQLVSRGNRQYISLNMAEFSSMNPGIYQVKSPSDSTNLALNVDRSESQVETVEIESFAESLEEKGVSFVEIKKISDGQSSTSLQLADSREFWKHLLLLALIFLLAEMAIIRFWH